MYICPYLHMYICPYLHMYIWSFSPRFGLVGAIDQQMTLISEDLNSIIEHINGIAATSDMNNPVSVTAPFGMSTCFEGVGGATAVCMLQGVVFCRLFRCHVSWMHMQSHFSGLSVKQVRVYVRMLRCFLYDNPVQRVRLLWVGWESSGFCGDLELEWPLFVVCVTVVCFK